MFIRSAWVDARVASAPGLGLGLGLEHAVNRTHTDLVQTLLSLPSGTSGGTAGPHGDSAQGLRKGPPGSRGCAPFRTPTGSFPRPRAPGSRFPWGWETCADTLGGGWREVVASHSVPQMFPKPSVSVPLSPGPLFWWQTTVLPHAGTPCQPSRPFHYLLLLNIFFRLLKSTFLSRSFGFAV